MRAAKPHELKTFAVPIMTARITDDELQKWFPVPFETITDPAATPEPSKGALIKLDEAGYVVVYFGEVSQQLTLRVPATVNGSKFLQAFFREVPIPKSRILWCRPDATVPKTSSVAKIPVRKVTATAQVFRSARTGKFVAAAKTGYKKASRSGGRASAKRK